MTNEVFVTILESRINAMRETLAAKAKEYATSDRLHNFKRSARLLDCSPPQALLGFLTKHLVSIVDMVQAGNHPISQWDEKIGDAINYLVLLEAIVKESA